jgi:hypothetical protein
MVKRAIPASARTNNFIGFMILIGFDLFQGSDPQTFPVGSFEVFPPERRLRTRFLPQKETVVRVHKPHTKTGTKGVPSN